MESITERQKHILETVVSEYIKRAFPIASDFLKKECGLNVSAATIRIDLADLAEQGFLEKTYVSSGRVPTDKGYRFYVDSLFEKKRKKIKSFDSFFEEIDDVFKTYHQLAEELAHLSSNLALAQVRDNFFLKEGWEEISLLPEFKNTEYFKGFIEMVRDFEEHIEEVDFDEGIRVFIGKEIPFSEKDYSFVVGKKDNKSIALLGPKRMDFEKNISLLHSLIESM